MTEPLTFLEKDSILNADMIDSLKAGLSETVYSGDDGVLLMKNETADGVLYMLSADSEEAAVKIAGFVKRKKYSLILHQHKFTDAVMEKLGLPKENREPCTLHYYAGEGPMALTNVPGIDIKPLTMADLNFVVNNYEDDRDYIATRIKNGMYGAYDHGKCTGFIGFHNDGSIGLLKVLPQYRKRGIGKALMARAVNRAVKEGRTPFSHIVFGNEVSIRFHESVNFRKADGEVCWIFT